MGKAVSIGEARIVVQVVYRLIQADGRIIAIRHGPGCAGEAEGSFVRAAKGPRAIASSHTITQSLNRWLEDAVM